VSTQQITSTKRLVLDLLKLNKKGINDVK